ncbi:MAG: hypothetical protein II886_00435 [Prevotella sp.]|nr:hypothetical protein [Prevotella sp.]
MAKREIIANAFLPTMSCYSLPAWSRYASAKILNLSQKENFWRKKNEKQCIYLEKGFKRHKMDDTKVAVPFVLFNNLTNFANELDYGTGNKHRRPAE